MTALPATECLPLWLPRSGDRPVAWHRGRVIGLREFRAHVAALSQRLPSRTAMVNLCEDRYHFLVAYAAALSLGHTVLLPAARAAQIVAEVERDSQDSYRCEDEQVAAVLATAPSRPSRNEVSADHVCMIGFTSGSSGSPKRFPKRWFSVHGSTARNAEAIRRELNIPDTATAWLTATIPPQHMYGMELSILLPLIGAMAVHSGRPLFPADIAVALSETPAPRVLVSTPVHLRAIVESAQQFPPTQLIVSATAPLDSGLAAAVEQKLGGRLLEMFGSTETCVLATRRTSEEATWLAYEGVRFTPAEGGTQVDTPWFSAPMLLQDVIETRGDRKFIVCGRSTDMVEVAGKRASLADITRRMLAIEGVKDAIAFQPGDESVGRIRRLAALVVSPGMTPAQISAELAEVLDPAFLPRPIRIVSALPRDDLGKVPREALLRMLREV